MIEHRVGGDSSDIRLILSREQFELIVSCVEEYNFDRHGSSDLLDELESNLCYISMHL